MRSGGVIVLSCINGFIEEFPFFFPAELILGSCGSGRGEEPSGESPPPDSDSIGVLKKSHLSVKHNRATNANRHSSSINAVNFSSTRTTKRFPVAMRVNNLVRRMNLAT